MADASVLRSSVVNERIFERSEVDAGRSCHSLVKSRLVIVGV